MKKFLIGARKFFNRKQFKYGGYAIVMTVALVAVLVIVNLLATSLDEKFNLSLDLTENRIYSLTMQTEHILEGLSQDVYIYTLFTDDFEDETFSELLDKYKTKSEYIHVENINLVKNPGAVKYYQDNKDFTISIGGAIISTSPDTNNPSQSFKVIDYYDLYSYSSETQSLNLFTGENAVTGAIQYVLNPDIPKVWFLKGHSDSSDSWAELAALLENENYDTGSLSLLGDANTMEKGDILIVLAPDKDLTNDEREVLIDFALDGGKIVFIFNPLTVNDLPNFMLILSFYNISMENGIVLEDVNNTGAYLYDQSYLVPSYNSHDITNPLITQSIAMVYQRAGAIAIGPEQVGIEIVNILNSSDESYLEPLTENMDGFKDDDAKTGPFPLAVAVTKGANAETDEVQMVIASSSAAFEQVTQKPTIGNYELFLNMITWLNPTEDDFYIRGKSLQASVLYFESQAQVLFVIIFVTVIIPLLAFAAALVVYLKRRHL